MTASNESSSGVPVDSDLRLTGFDLLLFALSIVSCVNLVLLVLVRNSDSRNVVLILDGVMALFFLADFLRQFWKAPSRTEYFFRHRGWLDLLSGVPLPGFRIAMLGRVVRAVKSIRHHGVAKILESTQTERATVALLVAIFLTICVVEFGSIWILVPEGKSDSANITSAGDALWWSYVTITTVGYGDQFPVTMRGRVIGFLTMSIGVALFAIITGFLANAFVSPKAQRRAQAKHHETQSAELRDLRAAVETLAEEVRLLREKDTPLRE
jgi:voltage-gated potassium channel